MFLRFVIFLLISPFFVNSQTYTSFGFNNTKQLALTKKGFFTYLEFGVGCSGGAFYEEIKGKYIVNKNKLKLYPKTKNLFLVNDNQFMWVDIDTIKFNKSFKQYINKSFDKTYEGKFKNFSFYKFITNYDIISIEGFKFLINSTTNSKYKKYDITHYDEFMDLASEFNSYKELSNDFYWLLKSKLHIGVTNKSINKESFIDALPQKQQSKFSLKPISINILQIKNEKVKNNWTKEDKEAFPEENFPKYREEIIFTLNKGKKQDIYFGMIFYFQKERDKCYNLFVTKVKNNISYAKLYDDDGCDFKNNKLSTRNPENYD